MVSELRAPPRDRRARWLLGLRVVVSAVLLGALVVSVPDLGSVLPRDHPARTAAFLVAAVLVTFVGIVLSAWRWQRVLVAFRARVRLRELTGHYLAGQFLGNVLPSTIGGDVLRIARGAGSTGSSETSFASVVLERLSGFVALPLLVVVGFLAMPSLVDQRRAWLALAIATGTLVALVVILTLAGSARLAGRFRDHENWTRFIGAVHRGVDNLRRAPELAVAILLTALAYQASVVFAVVLITEAIEVDLPVAALVAFVPAVAMAQVLPISIGGLGVREGLLVVFLVPLGATSGQAVAVGLLWYAAVLVVSMAGAPSFAIGHRGPRRLAAPTLAGTAPDDGDRP